MAFSGVLLKDKINLYNKEDIKVFAYDIGLVKLSKLKKKELVDLVAARLLDPDVMFYRMSIFDDRAIEIFEKGIGRSHSYSSEEYDTVCIFNEMDLAAVGKNGAGEGIFFVLDDVAEVWERVKNEKFDAYRKRASWVWKCLYWTEELYGYTPIENFLDVVNVKKGFRMTDDELIEIFDHFPLDRLWTYRLDDIFLSHVYAQKNDALYNLRVRQQGKDYYIPTVAEVEEYFDTGALLSTPSYQEMKRFIVKNLNKTESETEDILRDLWFRISGDDDMHDTMQWFWDRFVFEKKSQAKEIGNLFMTLANNTRMRFNKGHTPNEISARRRFSPGEMPVITAGSSQAAKLLAEAAPEIRKMGFGIDLDSNAKSFPVMGMPDGTDGPVKMVQKKVYPNDPCPCGSGKKFKKCCGR